MTQKVLVVGAGGQLGQELQRTSGPAIECLPRTRTQLDITDRTAVAQCFASVEPHLVINGAAYTAVDKAESDADAAQCGNVVGPLALAQACAQQGVKLIHLSTDFVFDGRASQPYKPDAPTSPLGEYGRSKRAGELAVQSALPQAVILRTGWVYSSYGSNFVKTMLRLMQEKDDLAVVADQIGTPTWAQGLAEAVWGFAARPQLSGIYHWSDVGVCSWYDFAVAVCEEALALGLLVRPVNIRPILATEYPTPAPRPAYSVLDKTSSWRDLAVAGVHWRQQLRAMLEDYKGLQHG
ncbi:MAG: dTDP-4-dehydrorhamnose reductase [Halioglobus sp.]|nr:dTDP-4-dehydrorhamnose reductase [Halioglobus sp.]